MMTHKGRHWGDTSGGAPRPTGQQVLPIAQAMYGEPLTDWQYLALARTFRRWYRARGFGDAMPIAAYDRWCGQVGIPHDECEAALHLPGYAIL